MTTYRNKKSNGTRNMIEHDLKRYSRSFMSNSKWRKFFQVINQQTLELNQCTWKLVNEKDPIPGHLPDARQLGDDSVGDCGALNGPFPFKIIEWILLPAQHGYRPYEKAPIHYESQDLQKVQETLDTAGHFEYELNEEGMKIFGYKP